MEFKPIEVFSEATNYAIVRMPGRRFPGCVIQGDSLWILLQEAKTVLERAEQSEDEELIGAARYLCELLQDRLDHYAGVLTEHKMPLPYSN